MEIDANPKNPSNVEATEQAGVPLNPSAEAKLIEVQLVKPLTPEQKVELAKLEKVIDAKLGDFFDVGDALMLIKTKELFRGTHTNFNIYCKERWGFGRSYANKLIGGAERIRLLPPGSPKPANEFQIRPFLDLKPEEFPPKWKAILDSVGQGKITSTIVQESLGVTKKKRRKRKMRKTNQRIEIHELLAAIRAELDEENVAGAKKILTKLEKFLKA
jgi:hypothetical protein